MRRGAREFCHRAHREGEPAIAAHGVARIDRHVDQRGFELAGIGVDVAVLVGHAGDGNFHLIYIIDPDRPEEIDEARRLNERLVLRALALGGTSTGEHGIGYGKLKFMETEHGLALDVMRTIKLALDPDNRMNPGKMVDLGS